MAYQQGLLPNFVEALNRLYEAPEGSWWRKMLADPDLFVAIRNNYLNIYYRGCSLAKVSFDGSGIITDTHYKYLLKPSAARPYVRAVGGQFQIGQHWDGAKGLFISSLDDVADLKAAARVYAGEEKKFVGAVIKAHGNIVDVEIALTKDAEEATDANPGEGASAKRIDIVALRWEDTTPVLDFYEAKLFGNKEIRGEKEAKVLSQIATYERLLTQYTKDIRDGFERSCENLLMLKGIPDARRSAAHAALHQIDKLRINTAPILIIAGFDKDQSVGPVWAGHKAKLSSALGPDRLIARGSASSVRLATGVAPGAAVSA